MSKKSEEIAEQIKANRKQAAEAKNKLDEEQSTLEDKLFVQNLYDIYKGGTENVVNGENTHTMEEEDYITKEVDTGKTLDGYAYARIVRHCGDPKYDDDFSTTSAFIFPNGENVGIGVATSGAFGQFFSVYNYDEKKEDSTLVLSSKGKDPVPEEFLSLYKQVEGAIDANTQTEQPTE